MKAVTSLLKNKNILQFRCLYKRPQTPSPTSQSSAFFEKKDFRKPKVENTSKKATNKPNLMKRDRVDPMEASRASANVVKECNRILEEDLQEVVNLVHVNYICMLNLCQWNSELKRENFSFSCLGNHAVITREVPGFRFELSKVMTL